MGTGGGGATPSRVRGRAAGVGEHLGLPRRSGHRQGTRPRRRPDLRARGGARRYRPAQPGRELGGMLSLLLLAGYTTTLDLIGNGMLALLSHPQQLAAVRADPAVLIALAAADRDPVRFRDPDRFDVNRRDAGGVAFGYGHPPVPGRAAGPAGGRARHRYPPAPAARPGSRGRS